MLRAKLLAAACFVSLALPASAEVYTNPDREWWNSFFDTLQGKTQDFEKQARKDPRYMAADEFTRADVLKEVAAELAARSGSIDTDSAVVKLNIQVQFGDYDAERGGFPISIFAPNIYIPVGLGRQLSFRNAEDLAIYKASIEEGKALRAKMKGQIIAEVTINKIGVSLANRNAYDGYVESVNYLNRSGELIASVTAEPEVILSESEVGAIGDGVRAAILKEAGLPELGTKWSDAKSLMQGAGYKYVVNTARFFGPKGAEAAYVMVDGQIVSDNEVGAKDSFRVYLQPADGDYATVGGGFNTANLMAPQSLDVKGLGHGLNCGTPGVNDKCAVLNFEPGPDGHVLTAAWGVMEFPEGTEPRDLIGGFGNPENFDISETVLGYLKADVQKGDQAQYNGIGVKATMASAGPVLAKAPVYDPLKLTTGSKVYRQNQLFVVQGADGRSPVVYLVSQ